MCLVTKQRDPILTTEDIVCYKIVRENISHNKNTHPFSSMYNYFDWMLNKAYYTPLSVYETDRASNCNFYDYVARTQFDNPNSKNCLFSEISDGFHAMLTYDRAARTTDFDDNEVVVECLIPKGSSIYKDKTDLVVSNKIIMVKRL